VVDADGRVVGLSTLILSQSGGSEGLGFAVPSNIVANVVNQLRATGKVVRGEIGVVAQSITPALAEGWKLPRDWGVVIADVDPDSEAAHAGLRAGDVIQSLNAHQVESARQFNAGIYRPAPGAAVRLSVLRSGAVLDFKVKVKEKNDAAHFSDLASHEENLIAELGIFAVDLTDALRDELGSLRRDRGGILVAARDADAPALDDYFQSGDVIYALNRETIKDVQTLRALLKKLKPGDAVAVQIERQGHLRFVAFELP
jgi:serine protease Do